MLNDKIAIVLWLYHVEQYPHFLDLLKPIQQYIHLYLGLCDSNGSGVDKYFTEALSPSNVTTEFYPNVGADILPFLNQLKTVKKNNHKYLIKIHSKKNSWGHRNQVHWLEVLMNDLLVKKYFLHNIQQMNSSDAQMLGCKSLILTDKEHTNTKHIQELKHILKLPKIIDKSFVGGNIFMARTQMFDIFLEHFDELEAKLLSEQGYISDLLEGKYCHSLERIFGYVASLNSKITYSFYPKKIIVNPKVPAHRLHLVELYNNYCYVAENLNIYGRILNNIPLDNITISWLNQNSPIIQQYKYLTYKKLINYAYT